MNETPRKQQNMELSPKVAKAPPYLRGGFHGGGRLGGERALRRGRAGDNDLVLTGWWMRQARRCRRWGGEERGEEEGREGERGGREGKGMERKRTRKHNS